MQQFGAMLLFSTLAALGFRIFGSNVHRVLEYTIVAWICVLVTAIVIGLISGVRWRRIGPAISHAALGAVMVWLLLAPLAGWIRGSPRAIDGVILDTNVPRKKLMCSKTIQLGYQDTKSWVCLCRGSKCITASKHALLKGIRVHIEAEENAIGLLVSQIDPA